LISDVARARYARSESLRMEAMIQRAMSKEAMKEAMTIEQDLLAKGRAMGEVMERAKSVLGVLEHRAIALPASMRERVLSTEDASLLQRWFDRAFSIVSAEELFESLEAHG
jgi:hypothetical protein